MGVSCGCVVGVYGGDGLGAAFQRHPTPTTHTTTYTTTDSLRSGAFPLARFVERGKKGVVADMGDPRLRMTAYLDVRVTRALGPGLVRQCEAFAGRVVEVRVWWCVCALSFLFRNIYIYSDH